jgi:tryptophan synthase alpha chain
MSRIRETFRRLKTEGRGALIPFLMAGDPTPEDSLAIAREVLRAGADILELGVPFSDPVADGPTIQRAGQRALTAGMNLAGLLAMVTRLREEFATPLVLMTYYNPVFRHGTGRFIREAAEAGADGVIVVDLPPEEGGRFYAEMGRAGLDAVLLVSPTTPPEREAAIVRQASGFVYVVARAGTTGARQEVPVEVREKIASLRRLTPLPLAVGFGISTPAHVRQVLSFADGAVVGSALVARIEEAGGGSERAATARETVRALAAGMVSP